MATVSLDDIAAARLRMGGRVARTPMLASPALGAIAGRPVRLKLDNRQITGSFKLRGATSALLALPAAARGRGVVTASTGNHGRALAHAARAEGVRALVCLSRLVLPNKIEGVRAAGAEVRVVGQSQDEAVAEMDRLVAREGLLPIPPFDHPAVIAGQGTAGLEIVEDAPDVESVLVPLSGGGLAAGIAAAVKALSPGARVFGVSMTRGAAMAASLEAGRPVAVEEVETLADSLGGGIGLDNRFTFSMCRDLLDGVILVDEEEIAEGIRHARRVEGEVVEGAGAVGIAALLAGKVPAGGPLVIFLSGRNIDPARHAAIAGAARGLAS